MIATHAILRAFHDLSAWSSYSIDIEALIVQCKGAPE